MRIKNNKIIIKGKSPVRTVDLLNTNTDKFGNGISPFSNNEHWQKILTYKKYIHKEKHELLQNLTICQNKKLSESLYTKKKHQMSI